MTYYDKFLNEEYLEEGIGHVIGYGLGVKAIGRSSRYEHDPQAKMIGIGIGAGIVAVTAAHHIWTTFMSDAAKRCGHESGDAFNVCKAKIKALASNKAIMTLKAGLAKCQTSKDPHGCSHKINMEIEKFKQKVAHGTHKV